MSDVGKEVIKTIITLVTTAFGLVAGLAWNDAIQALISQFFKAGSALTGVVTILLARMAGNMGVELDE